MRQLPGARARTLAQSSTQSLRPASEKLRMARLHFLRTGPAVVLAGLLAPSVAAEPADDASVLERAGCRVHTTAVDAQGVATVAAECEWPIATHELVATLRDPARLGEALSSLRSSERLPDGRVVQVHQPGWPFEDRQVTLDWRETALADGGLRIETAPAARQEPIRAGRTSIRESRSLWEIFPSPAGGTRLSYLSRYDAGGSLKPWLVRRFQKYGIAATLAELRAALSTR